MAKDGSRPASPECVGIIDTVAPRQGRVDQREQFVACVRFSWRLPEVDVGIYQIAQSHVLGERRRQKQPRIGDRVVVVEAHCKSVQAVR